MLYDLSNKSKITPKWWERCAARANAALLGTMMWSGAIVITKVIANSASLLSQLSMKHGENNG